MTYGRCLRESRGAGTLRRTDKEITDQEHIAQIIKSCQVCRLGLAKDTIPYIIPVSFGYDGCALYVHTAKEGRKIDFFTANSNVCFEFEHDVRIVTDDVSPCNWTFSYQSVIGHGTVRELTDLDEKTEGLLQIMKQYSDQEWSFSAESMQSILVWKITIESMTGKQSKDRMVLDR